ncbi:MAG: hypothetical protein KTR31_41750 [Myxococcales bacterium]|nr:hypothetical protein [Myxococcales bacterium]
MSDARLFHGPSPALLSLASLALLGGCAGHHVEPQLDWLPDSTGWEVRDVDEAEPPTWVAYDRDAPGASVKEIRVAGLVEAPPEVTLEALRFRMLDESYEIEGFELQVLYESEEEVVTYGLASMPWPFRDREVYERMRFTHDPETGEYHVDVQNIHDYDEPTPRGVVRVPLVHNRFTVTPTDWGASVLTSDSVHDLGGSFPNDTTYKPIRNGMIESLLDIRFISAELESADL